MKKKLLFLPIFATLSLLTMYPATDSHAYLPLVGCDFDCENYPYKVTRTYEIYKSGQPTPLHRVQEFTVDPGKMNYGEKREECRAAFQKCIDDLKDSKRIKPDSYKPAPYSPPSQW